MPWFKCSRYPDFCGGVMGNTAKSVAKVLLDNGYDDWVMVEHDTHLQDPKIDLKISRDYLKNCGI